MNYCRKCNCELPNRTRINGKVHNISGRKFCLKCSPFGKHNTRDITKPKRRPIHRSFSYDCVKRYRERVKRKMVAGFGGACCICGYDRCLNNLVFHHCDRRKKFDISHIRSRAIAWRRVVKELKKCRLLCNRCHGELHAGLVTISKCALKFSERRANSSGG